MRIMVHETDAGPRELLEFRFDFARPFLPASLVRSEELAFLAPPERLALNHIRAHSYLHAIAALHRALARFLSEPPGGRPGRSGLAALVRLAGEPVATLPFDTLRLNLARGFGSPLPLAGRPEALLEGILEHDALALALTLLHAGQVIRHHQAISRDDAAIDLAFKVVFSRLWGGSSAAFCAALVEGLADARNADAIMGALDGYLAILLAVDEVLMDQVELDLRALEQARGRALMGFEQDQFRMVQQQASRWTFLGCGMTDPLLLETLERVSGPGRQAVEDLASVFS